MPANGVTDGDYQMNYYDILNVSNTASEEDIRAAYIIMVKKYHPDVYIGNKCFAEEQMKLVNEAYDILHNKEKRKNMISV